MTASRLGLTALVLGAATWAQVALIPVVARSRGLDAPALAAALCALAVLAAGAALARRRPDRAAAVVAGAFPLALGAFALVLGRHAVPRFDAPARLVAAATGAAFLTAAAAWSRALRPAYPVTLAPLDDPPPAPAATAPHGAPTARVRAAALAAVTAVALFTAVVAPAVLAAREATSLDDRLGGEDLLRGRHALVAAAGLLVAVALVLGGGAALVRAGPPKSRRPSRAMAYLVWAAAAFVMRYWLDHAR